MRGDKTFAIRPTAWKIVDLFCWESKTTTCGSKTVQLYKFQRWWLWVLVSLLMVPNVFCCRCMNVSTNWRQVNHDLTLNYDDDCMALSKCKRAAKKKSWASLKHDQTWCPHPPRNILNQYWVAKQESSGQGIFAFTLLRVTDIRTSVVLWWSLLKFNGVALLRAKVQFWKGSFLTKMWAMLRQEITLGCKLARI